MDFSASVIKKAKKSVAFSSFFWLFSRAWRFCPSLDKIFISVEKAKKHVQKVMFFWLFSHHTSKNPTFDTIRHDSTDFAVRIRSVFGFFSPTAQKVQFRLPASYSANVPPSIAGIVLSCRLSLPSCAVRVDCAGWQEVPPTIQPSARASR